MKQVKLLTINDCNLCTDGCLKVDFEDDIISDLKETYHNYFNNDLVESVTLKYDKISIREFINIKVIFIKVGFYFELYSPVIDEHFRTSLIPIDELDNDQIFVSGIWGF